MAIIANLYIDQGTDFTITVDVTDAAGDVLDLTNYTALAQIRKTYSSSSVSVAFSTSISATNGQVTLSLNDTQTSSLGAGGITTRVVEGQAVVTPGVSRS
jgi:hypothetical protein